MAHPNATQYGYLKICMVRSIISCAFHIYVTQLSLYSILFKIISSVEDIFKTHNKICDSS